MTSTTEPTAVVRVAGRSYELKRATAADVRSLAIALADAFYDDPIFCWLMPDDDKRLEQLKRFYAIELHQVALKRDHVWTSTEFTGAAIVTPPGAWELSQTAMLAQATLFGKSLPDAARLLAAVAARHPSEPHYYFAHIGVASVAQSQGLGTSLMRLTLERCDMEGVPAYLEASSERNAALYERLGFEIICEMRASGSPFLRLMLRAPQHPSRSVSLHSWVLLGSDSTQGGTYG
jgi:ribosomal protein S18 acetylase RimI-like enzyme